MKSTIFAITRMVLSGLGAYLLGKNLFGHAIDESLWQMIVGSVMILISFVATVFDKTAGVEIWEGLVRQLLTSIGGLLTGLGIVKEETFAAVSTAILSLLPLILSLLGKKKSIDIATGALGVKDLSGVKELTETIKPVLNTPK